MIMTLQPAVHRTILVADVERFSDPKRGNRHQVAVRQGLYRSVQSAFRSSHIPWADCYHEDRGDGLMVLVPPEIPKGLFVEILPAELATVLAEYNRLHPAEEQIRLRMALHAGELTFDDYGVTGSALNMAFRLLDAGPVKTMLAESPGVLALITSAWFFEEVVRHSAVWDPAAYRPVRVMVKETDTTGWIHLPDPTSSRGGARPDATSPPAQLVVRGEPGVGKTALREAMTTRHRDGLQPVRHGPDVAAHVAAPGSDSGSDNPYGPWVTGAASA